MADKKGGVLRGGGVGGGWPWPCCFPTGSSCHVMLCLLLPYLALAGVCVSLACLVSSSLCLTLPCLAFVLPCLP